MYFSRKASFQVFRGILLLQQLHQRLRLYMVFFISFLACILFLISPINSASLVNYLFPVLHRFKEIFYIFLPFI